MRRLLAALAAACLLGAAAAAHGALQPGKLYVASALAADGPEPERAYSRMLMAAYGRVAAGREGAFKVLVHSSTEVNAFATMSSKGDRLLVFTTRLLAGLRNDESALAAVIGHEIGHHDAGHLAKRRDASGAVTVVATIAGAIVDYQLAKRGSAVTGIGRDAGGTLGNLVILKFSRDQEREADLAGLRLMAAAGYDPEGAVRLQERFLKAFGDKGVSITKSHPTSRERIENLRTQIRTDPAISAAVSAAGKARSGS